MFNFVSNIIPTDPSTFEDNLFLTFDMDWAPDFVMKYTFDILERNQIPSTWMITHPTPLLDNLSESEFVQFGIHPNFNDFFEVNENRKLDSVYDRVVNLIDLVPQARSVRSHSVTQSSRLHDVFRQVGLTHELNHYIPFSSQIVLRPWKLWNGLIKVPFGWEDDCDFENTTLGFLHRVLAMKGLRVLNFHPIHVYLNSTSLDIYERTRDIHKNENLLIHHKIPGYGTESFLMDLIRIAGKLGRSN